MPLPEKPTSTVRISKANLEKVNDLAADLGIAATAIIDLCVEDCLDALAKRRPITPRIVKLLRILKRQK